MNKQNASQKRTPQKGGRSKSVSYVEWHAGTKRAIKKVSSKDAKTMKTAIEKKDARKGRPTLNLKFPSVGKRFTIREIESKSKASYATVLGAVKAATEAKAVEVIGFYETGGVGRPTQVFEVKKDVTATLEAVKSASAPPAPAPTTKLRKKFRPLVATN